MLKSKNFNKDERKKFKKFILVFLFYIIIIQSNIIIAGYYRYDRVFNPPKCKTGNCGKLIIQLLDPITKNPINEKFKVFITEYHNKYNSFQGSYYDYISDNNGRFEFKIDEGKWCLAFMPCSEESKYAGEPFYIPREKGIVVNVEKGKITKYYHMVKPGGDIRVVFVNEKGERVKLNDFFKTDEHDWICFSISNENFTDENSDATLCFLPEHFDSDKKLSNYVFFNLPEGNYDCLMDFSRMKYGNYVSQYIENVKVNGGKTTIIKVELSKRTGIKGKVYDENGKPIKGVKIWISNKYYEKKGSEFIIEAKTYTDENGYYEIFGLKRLPIPYKISYHYEEKNKEGFKTIKINPVEGKVIIKNIKLKINN